MRQALIVLLVFATSLLALPAGAQDTRIRIQIDGVTRGSRGEVIRLAEVVVDPSLVGGTCVAGSSQADPTGSEHPGNDFIISSGETSAVIPDFEAVAGAEVMMEGTITLGTTITVDLRLGNSKVSSGGFLITLTCSPKGHGRFIDDDGSIFEADIEWLAEQGITRGCNPPLNTRFCPDDFVTRGEMAAFLVRALDLTDRLDDPFVDDDRSIFEADIEKLAAAKITLGCNPPINDRYCPDRSITRGEMAALLVRALGYVDDGGGDLFIDDDDSIFEADIDRLGTARVTLGCNPPVNDRYCPGAFVTRAQMAAFLHRALT